MKKIIALFLALFYLSACSMFLPSQQRVTVLTNVPNAKIYANGELVRIGQEADFYAKRNSNAQIMVTANGYYPVYRQIGSELNTAGILDILGGIIWLVPFIGLCFPGSKSLDNTNVAIQMVPNNKD